MGLVRFHRAHFMLYQFINRRLGKFRTRATIDVHLSMKTFFVCFYKVHQWIAATLSIVESHNEHAVNGYKIVHFSYRCTEPLNSIALWPEYQCTTMLALPCWLSIYFLLIFIIFLISRLTSGPLHKYRIVHFFLVLS